MNDYLHPDTRWESYKFNDQKDYIEKVVIEGYFHANVPDDVVKAYTTSEYLMAHAYYHWEMFDEALNKCLFTFGNGNQTKGAGKRRCFKNKK